MKVRHVWIFANGMVAVTDENGQQIPHLQGPIFEVMETIGKVADAETTFHVPPLLNVAWYFEKKVVEKVEA